MSRSPHFLALTALSVVLASCYGPEPRPFAGRGGRSLDQPPRYGEAAAQTEPTAPGAETVPGGPQVAAPNLDPAAAPAVDGGLTVTPPAPGTAPAAPGAAPTVPGGAATPPAGTTPGAPTAPAAAPGEVPFARAVPGKPGFVYSPRDPKKIISVEGLRPGQKARDPESGDIFRVPY